MGRQSLAIKIDLQKTYDRLSWEFIEDTLKVAKFPKPFVNLIMACVTMVSIQVIWNGKASETF